ncbi:MAG: S-methyl-5'-thioadenosine phosphorylase, partial [Candidatus Odinarchaeia archaeon]
KKTEKTKSLFGIIGGSGFYKLLEDEKTKSVKTPYGKSSLITEGYIDNIKLVFLSRHSDPNSTHVEHAIPPHKINYRANIYALFKLGVKYILATQSCGSLKLEIKPGSFVIPDQFIDLTKSRESTFFDGTGMVYEELNKKERVIHIDVTKPFCEELSNTIKKACEAEDIDVFKHGVYICTEGPRFETAAEIQAYIKMGGDIVGMTLVPEVVLSKELGICYSSIALVSNYAAGISKYALTFEEVIKEFERNKEKLKRILIRSVKLFAENKNRDNS